MVNYPRSLVTLDKPREPWGLISEAEHIHLVTGPVHVEEHTALKVAAVVCDDVNPVWPSVIIYTLRKQTCIYAV